MYWKNQIPVSTNWNHFFTHWFTNVLAELDSCHEVHSRCWGESECFEVSEQIAGSSLNLEGGKYVMITWTPGNSNHLLCWSRYSPLFGTQRFQSQITAVNECQYNFMKWLSKLRCSSHDRKQVMAHIETFEAFVMTVCNEVCSDDQLCKHPGHSQHFRDCLGLNHQWLTDEWYECTKYGLRAWFLVSSVEHFRNMAQWCG
jgi:hypothetical protein